MDLFPNRGTWSEKAIPPRGKLIKEGDKMMQVPSADKSAMNGGWSEAAVRPLKLETSSSHKADPRVRDKSQWSEAAVKPGVATSDGDRWNWYPAVSTPPSILRSIAGGQSNAPPWSERAVKPSGLQSVWDVDGNKRRSEALKRLAVMDRQDAGRNELVKREASAMVQHASAASWEVPLRKASKQPVKAGSIAEEVKLLADDAEQRLMELNADLLMAGIRTTLKSDAQRLAGAGADPSVVEATMRSLVRPRKPKGVLSDLRLIKRFQKFVEQDTSTHSPGELMFEWDRIGRWFTQLKDLNCGKETLTHALRAMGHVASTVGFPLPATKSDRLIKIARDWSASKDKEPDQAEAYSVEFMSWMEQFVLNTDNPKEMREVIGRMRLRTQASLRHDDLRRTALSRFEWVRWNIEGDPKHGTVRGIVTRAYATKTVPRHWSASSLGVTERGDGWLQALISLMIEAQPNCKWDDFTGSAINKNGKGWIQGASRGEDDAYWIRHAMRAAGFDEEATRRMRLHGSKATITSWSQHYEEDPRAVNVQGGWKDEKDKTMQGKYLREAQQVSLSLQERVLGRLRDGDVPASLDKSGSCLNVAPPPPTPRGDTGGAAAAPSTPAGGSAHVNEVVEAGGPETAAEIEMVELLASQDKFTSVPIIEVCPEPRELNEERGNSTPNMSGTDNEEDSKGESGDDAPSVQEGSASRKRKRRQSTPNASNEDAESVSSGGVDSLEIDNEDAKVIADGLDEEADDNLEEGSFPYGFCMNVKTKCLHLALPADESDYYDHKAVCGSTAHGDYWRLDCGAGIAEGEHHQVVPHKIEFTWCADCAVKIRMAALV